MKPEAMDMYCTGFVQIQIATSIWIIQHGKYLFWFQLSSCDKYNIEHTCRNHSCWYSGCTCGSRWFQSDCIQIRLQRISTLNSIQSVHDRMLAQIFDYKGSLVIEQTVYGENAKLTVSNLNAGLYMLVVTDSGNGHKTTARFIKY